MADANRSPSPSVLSEASADYAGILLTPVQSSHIYYNDDGDVEEGDQHHPHPLLRSGQSYRKTDVESFDRLELGFMIASGVAVLGLAGVACGITLFNVML